MEQSQKLIDLNRRADRALDQARDNYRWAMAWIILFVSMALLGWMALLAR